MQEQEQCKLEKEIHLSGCATSELWLSRPKKLDSRALGGKSAWLSYLPVFGLMGMIWKQSCS